MANVRRVLHDFAGNQVGASAVMRAVMGHSDWLVPAVYASQVLGRTPLVRMTMLGDQIQHPPNTLLIYSDLEIATFAHQHGMALGPFEGGISGAELFSRIHPSLHAIAINEGAGQQDKLYLQAPSFGNAPVWADVVGFEAWLGQPTSPQLIAAIRRYDAYFVALHEHDGSIVTLQNYPGLRNAGLLFTAPDCLDTFMQKVGASTAGITTGQTTGERVIGMLPELGIDGLVINPFGPGAMRPFMLRELAGASAARG